MSINKKLLWSSVLCGMAVSVFTLPAKAQEGDDYAPKGVRVGSFQAFPKLTVDEVFDDNLYSEKTGATDDTITIISPELSLRSDWNNHDLRIDVGSKIGRFMDNSDDDYEEFNLRGRTRIDVSNAMTVTGDLRFQALTEERGGNDVGSDASAPVEYDKIDGELSLKYKPNRFGVALTGSVSDADYDDNATTAGGTTNNDDRDRQDIEGSVRLGYEIQDGYEGYVLGAFNDRSYDQATDDNGANRDSDGYNLQAGLAVDLSDLVRADVAAGYMSQDYTDASLKDADGYSANANIRWSLTELTTIRATLSRSINETTSSDVSATIGTDFSVGVDHELLRNLTLNANLKLANSDYEGDPSNREDDKMTTSVGVDYLLNRNIFAGAKYTYEERDSNIDSNDYDNNVIKMTLGAQF